MRVSFTCQAVLVLSLCAVQVGCGGGADEATGPRRITYWEKWTGFEGEAMGRVVEAFNANQRDKAAADPSYRPIEVEMVTVARVDQKLLVAIAGDNPPDVAGVWVETVYPFADKGALVDLTDKLAAAGITRDKYIGIYWDMCEHRGRMWALPTTPWTTALHWNKRLFREAGLDPDTPPKTIEQLDAWAEKLTRWEVTTDNGTEVRTGYCPDVPDENKRLIQVGFLPAVPGWWAYAWGPYFGGTHIDADGRLSAHSPANVRAYAWVASFTRHLGEKNVQKFISSAGNFSSPQNPFMAGKVAMEVQGVWMYNFIEKYAPGMKWGAAPFPHPADRPDLARSAVAGGDTIVIPTGSRHKGEAFAFITFVNSRRGMEILCGGHRKFLPLKPPADGPDTFLAEHPHPYIRMFSDLSNSPNAIVMPKTGIWAEYQREMVDACTRIQNLSVTPDEALAEVQERMSKALERSERRAERRERRR